MSSGPSFSIVAIPAYWILALLPHSYAIHLASGGNLLNWDNRNPRSAALKANCKARLTPATYERWERAEAASANAFENAPLFIAAVLTGHLARLPTEAIDRYARVWLALRVAHSLVYINTSSKGWTYVRSILYFVTLGVSFKVFVDAARKIAVQ